VAIAKKRPVFSKGRGEDAATLGHVWNVKTMIEEGEPPITPRRSPKPVTKLRSRERALRIKTILVPLDFSRASMHALKYVIPLAKEFEATIHLVHVQPADELTTIENAAGLMLTCADAIALMQDRLSEALRNEGRFWPDNCHVVTGRPFEEICKLARQIKADLVVLPTRGLGRLKHVLLGSTAERVVRSAPCPVLIPRGAKFKSVTWNGAAGTVGFKLRKILVPVDFSKCSVAGVRYAARLAKDTGATLRLFHVVFPYTQIFALDRVRADLTPLIKSARGRAREEMSELMESSFLRGIPCETEIRSGPVIDEIVGESIGRGIDLIVTSTHGYTGFKRAVIGSVAEHVVRYAECPVIIVPSRGYD
jgi:nucleotide-binding universal stress UspA family protein